MKQQTISIINGVEISAVSDESHNVFVPVKPICQAIGVDHEAQRQRILRHYILSCLYLKGNWKRWQVLRDALPPARICLRLAIYHRC